MIKITSVIGILYCIVSTVNSQPLSSYSKLPTVYAQGGEGKNKIWVKPSAAELEGPEGWLWGVCSSPIAEKPPFASSILAQQGNVKYGTKNLMDDNPTTAWVEGNPDYGIGEYLESNEFYLYRSLSFLNGYQKSPKSFIENSRVKKLLVTENGINRSIIILQDEMGSQEVAIEDLRLNLSGENKKIRLTILEVYPGTKFKDVAISEIYTSGCCIAGDAVLSFGNEKELKFNEVVASDYLNLLDASGKIIQATLKSVGTVVHKELIEIKSENGKSISVTPMHKIYVDDLQKLVAAKDVKPGNIIFSVDGGIINPVSVIAVHYHKGEFKTYYFNKLDKIAKDVIWPLKAIVNGIVLSDEYLERLNFLNQLNKGKYQDRLGQ